VADVLDQEIPVDIAADEGSPAGLDDDRVEPIDAVDYEPGH
jgi:hypothetical protein